MSDALNELGQHIELKRPDCVLSWDVTGGELTVDVAPANLAGFVEFLQTDSSCKFSSLVDITAVDRAAYDKVMPTPAMIRAIAINRERAPKIRRGERGHLVIDTQLLCRCIKSGNSIADLLLQPR